MIDTAMRHPRMLCALTIVRDRHVQNIRSAIRSTALLSVTPDGAGARFAMQHRAFDRTVARAEILIGIAKSIPAGATLIARAPRLFQHHPFRSSSAGGPLPPADLQLLGRERPDLTIFPLHGIDYTLEEIAAAYRINRPGPGTATLARSRRAPEEAQRLWLAFLWSQCSRAERTSLSSAWRHGAPSSRLGRSGSECFMLEEGRGWSTKGKEMLQKYLILDTESIFDPYLREAYAEVDPTCKMARIGSRSLVAIAGWTIEIDALGRVATGPLHSWTLEECGNEGQLVANAFTFMRQHADHQLVTWGGLATDCQVLQLAAISADLELPRQLAEAQGPRWRDPRHLDLGLALKGVGKTWHHLSEVLLRAGVPVALLLGKADPDIRPEKIEWGKLRQHCEADVLFTALALTAWLRLQGGSLIRIPGAHLVLLEAFLRARATASKAPLLRRLADELQRVVVGDFDHAA